MSEEPATDRDLILVDHLPGGLVVPQGTPIHQCPSTLPLTREGMIRRMNAMGASTLELGRDGTLLLDLADILAYPREDVDEATGETKQYSWLVLIDTEGRTFGTSSQVVSSKVYQLLCARIEGLLGWPVEVQVVSRKGRKSGRTYHDLVLVE